MTPNPLTPRQVQALRDLKGAWPDVQQVVVGAAGLGFHLEMTWRKTNDLDLAVAIPVAQFPAGLEKLDGWTRDERYEHAWTAPGNIEIDILPVGAPQLASGKLVWPKSGDELNVVGYRHVYERAVTAPVAADFTVQVAPVPVIVLLKMAAYLDRPAERDRDLTDIGYAMEEYLADAEDRRFAEEFFTLDLSYEQAPPYWLGRDLGALLNEPERLLARRFLGLVRDDGTVAHNRMVRLGPAAWRRESETLLSRLAALAQGLEREVKK